MSRSCRRKRFALQALLLALLLPGAFAHAQSGEEAPKLAQSTYNTLTDAREQMSEERYDEALRTMRALLAELEERDYDRAVTLQTMAYAHLGKNDYDAAIESFREALALDVLPEEAQLQVLRSLASLYAGEERLREARDTLLRWFERADSPGADDYALLGNIHARLEEYGAGIAALRKAIELEDTPKEPYYQLLLALCFEAGRYSEAAGTLERMVRFWPDKVTYWQQLASIYINLDRHEEAHAILRVAHRRGLLEEEDELMNLVRLAFSIDLPDHAARVLEEEMAAGRIPETERNLQMLAEAWASARERDKAIATYQRLAEMTGNGEYDLRQARLYMADNAWAEVVRSAQAALNRGGLESPGRAWMLLGMAHIEQENLDQGLEAMRRAAEYGDTAQRARQWIAHVESRREGAGS